jgi:hypothetical protein
MPDIHNHGFSDTLGAVPNDLFNTFVRSDDDDSRVSYWNSVLLASTPNSQGTQGLYQSIGFADSAQVRQIYVGGYSKAMSVTGMPDANYAIYVDAILTDKRTLYGQSISFSTGTHDWEYQDAILRYPLPIVALNVSLLFRNHDGLVWFDDIILRVAHAQSINSLSQQQQQQQQQAPSPPSTLPPPPLKASSVACIGGMAHNGVFSFVQEVSSTWFKRPISYALDIPGEFVLFRSETLELQVRVQRRSAPQLGAVVSGVAVRVCSAHNSSVSDRVALQFSSLRKTIEDPRVYHNGVQQDIRHTPDSLMLKSGLGVLSWDSLTSPMPVSRGTPSLYYTLEFDGGIVVVVVSYAKTERTMHVVVQLSSALALDGVGLLGNCASGQLVYANGMQVPLETLSHSEDSPSTTVLTDVDPSSTKFSLPSASELGLDPAILSSWSVDHSALSSVASVNAREYTNYYNHGHNKHQHHNGDSEKRHNNNKRQLASILAHRPTSLDDLHAMQASWLVTRDTTLFVYSRSTSVDTYQPVVARQ